MADLARLLLDQGKLDEAKPLMEEENRRVTLGPKHPDTLAINSLSM